MNKRLHIVSFDVPYPANYGGIIDVFYKIKALSKLGVEIYLHAFNYGKEEQVELNKYCKQVLYYQRNSFFKSFISKTPFIVKSRGNKKLVHNLKKIPAPILFDGLHTTYVLNIENFNHQKTYVRAHNIEHHFYKGLKESEKNLFKKAFYKLETYKLKKYEQILKSVDGVFSISPHEQRYFLKKYGNKSHYIPVFHQSETKAYSNLKGKNILFHGNLLVSENKRAAIFLIEVYKNSPFRLVIASNYKSKTIAKEISKYQNICFTKINNQEELNQLFKNAHINVLPTFQQTGIKLKLLNALHKGRFIIANDDMVENTGLESLTERANTKEEFLNTSKKLFELEFTDAYRNQRTRILEDFNPNTSAEKMIEQIF